MTRERQLGRADVAAAQRIGAGFLAPGATVIIVNTDRFFLTHRSAWGLALTAAGSRVIVVASDTGNGDTIRDLGMEFIPLAIGRESIGARQSMVVAASMLRILLRLRPQRVLLVATVAYSLGWPAALFLPRSRFVLVATGAGRVMSDEHRSSLAARVVRLQLRFSRGLRNVHTLFQLETDREWFVSHRLAHQKRSHVVAGTGIDVEVWKPLEPRTESGPLRVLFAARLFKEKGIYGFIEVARQLRDSGATFVVAGAPDLGVATTVQPSELKLWQDEGIIDYVGQVDDMLSLYQSADVFVLPSTHPEGTPRVLIECSACGVPSVVSDQPGCRAVVQDGATGLVVDPTDLEQLGQAVQRLVVDPQLRRQFGRAARQKALDEFAIDSVLVRVLEIVGADRA